MKYFIFFFVAIMTFINLESKEYKFDTLCGFISKNVFLSLNKNYNLIPCGSGGSAPDYNLNYLSFRFNLKQNMDIDKARELLIICANEYLNRVNNCVELKKYMTKYPFDENNCDIAIFFVDNNNNPIQFPYLCVAGLFNGRLYYASEDELEDPYFKKTEFRESYQEALKKFNIRN